MSPRARSSAAAIVPPAPAPAPAAVPDTPTVPLVGYRGLKVWQRAMDLAAAAYGLAKGCTDAALAAELWRSASAIPTQIAFGNTLHDRPDFVDRLAAAQAHLARVESVVQLADRIGAIPTGDASALLTSAVELSRMLRALIRTLRSREEHEVAEVVGAD